MGVSNSNTSNSQDNINQIKKNNLNEYENNQIYENKNPKKIIKSHLKSDFGNYNNFNFDIKDENELYKKYNISKYYTINYNDVIYNLLKMPDKSAYLVIDRENYFNNNFFPSSKTNNKNKEILYLMNDSIGKAKLFRTKLTTDPIGCGLKNENQLNSDPETLRNILIKINKDPNSRKNIIKETVVNYSYELSYDEYQIIKNFYINERFDFSHYEEGKNFYRCFEKKEWILHLPYNYIITFYSTIFNYLELIYDYNEKIYYIKNELKIFEISKNYKYKLEYYNRNSGNTYYRYDYANETLIEKRVRNYSNESYIFFSNGIKELKLKKSDYEKFYNDKEILKKIIYFQDNYRDYFENNNYVYEKYSLNYDDKNYVYDLYIFPGDDKNLIKFKENIEKLTISVEKIKIIDKIAQKTDYKANIYDGKKIISNFSKDILICCKLLKHDNINVKNKLKELKIKKEKVIKDIINNDNHIQIFKNKEEKFDIFYDNKRTSIISPGLFGNYKYFISSNTIEVIDNQNNSKKFRLADQIEKYNKKNQCHQLLLNLFKKTSSFNQYTIYDEALSNKYIYQKQQELKYSDVYII